MTTISDLVKNPAATLATLNTIQRNIAKLHDPKQIDEGKKFLENIGQYIKKSQGSTKDWEQCLKFIEKNTKRPNNNLRRRVVVLFATAGAAAAAAYVSPLSIQAALLCAAAAPIVYFAKKCFVRPAQKLELRAPAAMPANRPTDRDDEIKSEDPTESIPNPTLHLNSPPPTGLFQGPLPPKPAR